MRESEDFDDKSIVFVDKAVPSLPLSPLRLSTVQTITASKRRSMSVSDVDSKATPTTASAAPSPPVKASNSRRNESGQPADGSLHGLLDLFKGELSTLDPSSGTSLDLRDPSTPARQTNRRSNIDNVILSSLDTKGENWNKKSLSDPFGGRPNHETEKTPTTATSPAFPPRTSSLKSKSSARNSLTSTTLRQSSAPSRVRTTPPTSSTAAQNLSPRSANGVRHYSNASASEPSLVPFSNESRSCKSLSQCPLRIFSTFIYFSTFSKKFSAGARISC